jgi:polysaccharide export outer membrane protein
MKPKMLFFLVVVAALTGAVIRPAPLWPAEPTDPHAGQQTPVVAGSIAEESTYIIGPGDVLNIAVWKEAALSQRVVVLPDGFITFPLIGIIKAEGCTVEALHAVIEEKLIRFIPQPSLSVSIEQVNSMQVYVIGKVNKSGRFELNTQITVLQALALAGGLNPFAKRNQIRIFRKKDGQTVIFDFDYNEVSRGRQLKQNILLNRGDVVVVP